MRRPSTDTWIAATIGTFVPQLLSSDAVIGVVDDEGRPLGVVDRARVAELLEEDGR